MNQLNIEVLGSLAWQNYSMEFDLLYSAANNIWMMSLLYPSSRNHKLTSKEINGIPRGSFTHKNEKAKPKGSKWFFILFSVLIHISLCGFTHSILVFFSWDFFYISIGLLYTFVNILEREESPFELPLSLSPWLVPNDFCCSAMIHCGWTGMGEPKMRWIPHQITQSEGNISALILGWFPG